MAVLLVDVEVFRVVRVPSPSLEVGPGEPASCFAVSRSLGRGSVCVCLSDTRILPSPSERASRRWRGGDGVESEARRRGDHAIDVMWSP